MRNWNRGAYLFDHYEDWYRFGSYLWGIETSSETFMPRPSTSVWIVPMRNWNKIKRTFFPHCDLEVWIVPMRNWNHENAKIRAETDWFGLDRTYEELKLRIMSAVAKPFARFGSYLWGIETGVGQTIHSISTQSLDRTYEELKPKDLAAITSMSPVWIVPMRNWNSGMM